ncbi:hypothetical protein QBC39DRAFT_298311 [Podospora conica]|nr:hypothetical protein QBC39DRAFT_298311 [Schizothecium conicum]
MAAVEVAMRRSLRDGFVDVLVASLRPALARRDLEGQVADVKSAFSSWDNCMQATYCKWPVIAVIIVGGLIVLSVAWCIIRCACCGLSCCCSCFSCLKCCGNCCGCCDPPRGKRHKYLDEPYIPPNQGYKVQPPMNPHFPPVVPMMTPASTGVTTGVTPGYAISTPAAYATSTPQYAEFDVSKPKPGGEDALPAMPVWEDSSKKKVMVEEEEVEMDQLKKPEGSGQNGALAPGVAGAMPHAVSPVGSPGLNRSPYGPPGGNPGQNGYYPASGIESDPYAQPGQGYGQASGGYGQATNQPVGQGYGVAMAGGAGRRSPYTDAGYGQQQGGNRGYGSPQQDTYNNINNYSTGQQQQGYDNFATAQSTNQGYGGARHSPVNELAGDNGYGQPSYGQEQPVRHSPAPQYGQGNGARQSPAPQANYGGYNNTGGGGGYDSRGQYSTDSQRPLQPVGGPYRQYSRDAVSPAPAAAPVGGDAGFDFGTAAYSRPQQQQQGYRQPSPYSGQQQNNGGYPGYKPYGGGQQGGQGW